MKTSHQVFSAPALPFTIVALLFLASRLLLPKESGDISGEIHAGEESACVLNESNTSEVEPFGRHADGKQPTQPDVAASNQSLFEAMTEEEFFDALDQDLEPWERTPVESIGFAGPPVLLLRSQTRSAETRSTGV
eukprot:CAMPEP_0169132214 /NCGR_PEP_ID=MMETSP1015-20121227/38667_1 /TAXON_ID=342587 /ORGANISM="Karlodinium micrum, Strain CCMP2283" /LENGTH=134 /DNA_ID=CAMNT_0009196539 /DNA_START=72 /DNA_END=476 /DNA_ORIENTATION=+